MVIKNFFNLFIRQFDMWGDLLCNKCLWKEKDSKSGCRKKSGMPKVKCFISKLPIKENVIASDRKKFKHFLNSFKISLIDELVFYNAQNRKLSQNNFKIKSFLHIISFLTLMVNKNFVKPVYKFVWQVGWPIV